MVSLTKATREELIAYLNSRGVTPLTKATTADLRRAAKVLSYLDFLKGDNFTFLKGGE